MYMLFVKEERERQGVSVRALAEMAEISKTYLSEIERGERDPSVKIICKIAVALNVPLCYLIHCGGGNVQK